MGKALIIKGANFGESGIGVDVSNKLILAYDKSLFDTDSTKQVIGNSISGMIVSNPNTNDYAIQKLAITNTTAAYKIKITHNFAAFASDVEGIYCVALIADTNDKLLGKVQCFKRDSTERTEEHTIEASKYPNIGYIYLCGLQYKGYRVIEL